METVRNGDCTKKNVTMHEMGHALGLEHWDTYSNVMRDYITKYYYQCDFGDPRHHRLRGTVGGTQNDS